MRCFLDTEFTGMDRPALISLAFVADDGSEFYAEIEDGWTTADCSNFVVHHVLPHLLRAPDVTMTRAQLREALPRWLASLGEPATVIYDLRADWRLLSGLFDDLPNQHGVHGRRLIWKDSAIEQSFERQLDAWFATRGPRHNALVDARGFRAAMHGVEDRFGRQLAE